MNETCLLLVRNSQAKDTKVSQKLPYSMMSMVEKEMATRSSILAWRILYSEEPGGLLSLGPHRVGHDWSNLAACVLWKRKWQPLQYSCLENPRDRGAWWAAVYGVGQLRSSSMMSMETGRHARSVGLQALSALHHTTEKAGGRKVGHSEITLRALSPKVYMFLVSPSFPH